MAIPSGSGTEVLKRLTSNALNAATATFTTVPAHHIWTILSINVCSSSGSDSTVGITVNDGTNDIDILTQHANTVTIPERGTYVHSDRIVLTAGDILKVHFGGNSADIWVSYIDQDWS